MGKNHLILQVPWLSCNVTAMTKRYMNFWIDANAPLPLRQLNMSCLHTGMYDSPEKHQVCLGFKESDIKTACFSQFDLKVPLWNNLRVSFSKWLHKAAVQIAYLFASATNSCLSFTGTFQASLLFSSMPSMAADDFKRFKIEMWTSLVRSIFAFQMDANANKQARVSAAFDLLGAYFFRRCLSLGSQNIPTAWWYDRKKNQNHLGARKWLKRNEEIWSGSKIKHLKVKWLKA